MQGLRRKARGSGSRPRPYLSDRPNGMLGRHEPASTRLVGTRPRRMRHVQGSCRHRCFQAKAHVALLFGGKVKHKQPLTPPMGSRSFAVGLPQQCPRRSRLHAGYQHLRRAGGGVLHERGFTVSTATPRDQGVRPVGAFAHQDGQERRGADRAVLRGSWPQRVDADLRRSGNFAPWSGGSTRSSGCAARRRTAWKAPRRRSRAASGSTWNTSTRKSSASGRRSTSVSTRPRAFARSETPGINPRHRPRVRGTHPGRVGDVTRFESAKHLAGSASPPRFQSGSSSQGAHPDEQDRNARIRKALFMPALVALRHNEAFIAFRQRLLDAGKAKMLIVGAAMRKLVHVIYGVLKSGRPFNAKLAMGDLNGHNGIRPHCHSRG